MQAELAGVLTFAARWDGTAPHGLRVTTPQAAVARLVYRLLKSAVGVRPGVVAGRRTYRLEADLTPELWRWMDAWPGLLDRHRRYTRRQLQRTGLAAGCCRRAFLRGAFLVAGSVSSPRGGYHLEILLPSEAWGFNLAEILASFGLTGAVCRRRGSSVLYFKDGEQIARLLTLVGAHTSYLEFESARVLKEVRSRVNRLVNCDTANLNRTVDAGLKQAALIARLRERGAWTDLPEGLRQVAELRLAHPEASLRELGQMLTPRLGKTAVRYRLKLLEQMAVESGAKAPAAETGDSAGAAQETRA
jgi:DNA-binding protein WhiA